MKTLIKIQIQDLISFKSTDSFCNRRHTYYYVRPNFNCGYFGLQLWLWSLIEIPIRL
jgi:hypothetical protein